MVVSKDCLTFVLWWFMLNVVQSHPLADFLGNHREYLERLKTTKQPEVLTVDGTAELVLMDAETYQRLNEKIAEAETIAAIREGYESAQRGDMKPAEQVFSEMKNRYEIPG